MNRHNSIMLPLVLTRWASIPRMPHDLRRLRAIGRNDEAPGYVPESLDTSLNRCLTLDLITAGNRRSMDN
jgi:hypothetical protein